MSALLRRRATAAAKARTQRSAVVDKKRSILSRVGDANESLTRIVAKNIGETVSAADVRTLFASAGKVERVAAVLGASGSATYEIDFDDPVSARVALSRFDQRTLDGRKMTLSLVTPPRKDIGAAAASLFAAAVDDAHKSTVPRERPQEKKKLETRDNREYLAIDVTRTQRTTSVKKPAAAAAAANAKKKSGVVLDVASAFEPRQTRKTKPATAVRVAPKAFTSGIFVSGFSDPNFLPIGRYKRTAS
ncbi:hypothetical protein CTAYLR_004351 [Chrysophaeum taylorii]|uniref:RRM domain-containing protein n=1 Tax=Chrysophaeum taylorii TaxID=2483200 RepID=A0AAD7XQU6_9STRA|nr:hypothetical protein CTAYLR_004351 [Chrysophaeum taylorii]